MPIPLRPSRSAARSAFTLIELLVVMAVLLLVAALSRPALSALVQNQTFLGGVYRIDGLIRQAKATAMGENTFVWLGFSTRTEAGTSSLTVTAVASRSGLSTDLASGNFQAVTKPVVLKNVSLDPQAYAALAGSGETGATDVGQSAYRFTEKAAGVPDTSFSPVLAFGPDGHVTLNDDSASRRIAIGLRGGVASAARPATAGIEISGLTGEPTILRP